MTVPFIDISKQHASIREELKAAVMNVMDSQKFVLGAVGQELEQKISQRLGVEYAVGLASGSDALFLALQALGIGPGDEVITTPFTFFATAGSVSRVGAKPIFVDIDATTFNLDPSKIEAKINSKTKAIIPVHLYGRVCEMDAIVSIAKKHGLMIIEDAAQAFGALYKGKHAGAIGQIGCFSFYPTKNMGGGGDGGMLVTRSRDVCDRVRKLRDHGANKKYFHDVIGVNSRLDEIQAAMLLVKLKYINEWNSKRFEHAKYLNERLSGLPLQLPLIDADHHDIFHLYTITTQKRDSLSDFLTKNQIGNGVYYPLPLHLQECYRSLGYQKGSMPISEATSQTALSLPMFAELNIAQLDAVIQAVSHFFKVS